MRVLFLDPIPPEVTRLLDKWRSWGDGRRWEVWEGVLHIGAWPEPSDDAHVGAEPSRAHAHIQQQLAEMLGPATRAAGLAPAVGEFRVGGDGDFRTPNGGLFRDHEFGLWSATAALVIEFASPGDETQERLGFYAAHQVDELLIVDPQKRTVDWLALADGGYRPIERSALIDLGPAELAARIDWPPVEPE